MTKANKLIQAFEESFETDDNTNYVKLLKKCNQSDLRQAFGDNKWQLINIVFCGYENAFENVSQDFIRQMFTDLSKKEKEYLQRQVSEMIYYIADDIYKDNNKTLQYFCKHIFYIKLINNYIKYCKPKNQQIRKQYQFIINEAFYYLDI